MLVEGGNGLPGKENEEKERENIFFFTRRLVKKKQVYLIDLFVVNCERPRLLLHPITISSITTRSIPTKQHAHATKENSGSSYSTLRAL